MIRQTFRIVGAILLSMAIASCDNANTLEVTATAYTSHKSQTDSQPNIAAGGAELKPGMQVIAVSRDLLEIGLGRGKEVEIEGFSGTWKVRDKMHARWEKRIDIYMGMDVKAAKEWGKQKVVIRWEKQ
jgi:3D (Asp-Asp-Asp) domain-containing protein